MAKFAAMKMSARQLAALLNGQIEGDPNVEISNISKIEEAERTDISFIANPKYEQFAKSTRAGILIVSKDFDAREGVESTLIRVENAYVGFTRLLQYVNAMQERKKGIESGAFIHPSASLGKDIYIGAQSYIGENAVIGDFVTIYSQVFIGENVQIGKNTILYPGVKVYRDCQIGSDCILHAGAVIGSDGFGFAPDKEGTYQKIPQLGNVIIEDSVEVGANTTIDRATIGSTIIRSGVKLDNLIQVAHNVEIGSNTVIAAQAGISGSTTIGPGCMIGGQAGLVGHIKIAANTRINAQSGVISSVKQEGKILTDSPAFEYRKALRSQVVYRKLPELEKRLDDLDNAVNNVNKKL